jgi:hypothetical protein
MLDFREGDRDFCGGGADSPQRVQEIVTPERKRQQVEDPELFSPQR